jgi:hypothetical protein
VYSPLIIRPSGLRPLLRVLYVAISVKRNY